MTGICTYVNYIYIYKCLVFFKTATEVILQTMVLLMVWSVRPTLVSLLWFGFSISHLYLYLTLYKPAVFQVRAWAGCNYPYKDMT